MTPRRALVFGVANERSLAWAIARQLRADGMEVALSYATPAHERRVKALAQVIEAKFIAPCDVSKDVELDAFFAEVRRRWDGVDTVVHSVAYANPQELERPFHETSREGFRVALDVSAYSLIALAHRALPLMEGRAEGSASILTLTNSGSERVVPHYNVMGLAKAALEAAVKYLAQDLGPRGIRVNAVSAGPVRTLAASAIADFQGFLEMVEKRSPLRKNIEGEDVGALAAFLCSPAARRITGSCHFVDSGTQVLGA